MIPNTLLTSGSTLQIPSFAGQRLPLGSASASQNSSSLPTQDSTKQEAEFSGENLSNEQVMVLRAIASGKGITAAAQEAGVNRSTIYPWQRDPHFQHWLCAWQSQTKDSGRNILLTLIERAARIVERALEKDDVRVAMTLLTKLGVLAAKDNTFDMIQDRPSEVVQGTPAPTKVAMAAPSPVKAPVLSHVEAATPAKSDPDDLTELHRMINELETKFGDMLPGGRR